LVAARAKGFVTCAGKDNDIDIRTLAADIHSVEHFKIGFGSERVINLRTVNGDFCNTFKKLKLDVLVVFNALPNSCRHILNFL